jgi:hypothetical protein
VKMQQEYLYQWRLMVDTPSTLEKGHGQWSYVGNMENSHSMEGRIYRLDHWVRDHQATSQWNAGHGSAKAPS